MSHFTSTHILVSDGPDEDMTLTDVEVLEMDRSDWDDIADALEFFARMEAMNSAALKRISRLAKDIRSEILAKLPEETA